MILRVFLYTTILSGCFIGGLLFYVTHHKCVDFSALEQYSPGVSSIVLDDEGNEWARFSLDRREPIMLDAMAPQLIDAFIAAEDWSFFSHGGISYKGIIRSILVNVWHGRIVQGASTITQQLVKLLFFDSQKTFSRKCKEQLYAVLVEQQFSKEQILQTYLNHVYFGCGIYGVQAASQRFWGKNAADLSCAECALLAGIVRSPGKYCPLISKNASCARRNTVLSQMLKLRKITQKEYDDARAESVQIVAVGEQSAAHAKEMIRLILEEKVGKKELYCGGLIISTTINSTMQREAQTSFAQHMKVLEKNLTPAIDGALMTIEVKTGAIKALIGGKNFTQSKFNRALQARRQMGSIFKPILYAAAIDAGMHFGMTEVDEPIELVHGGQTWKPNNYDREFTGRITLARALSYSNNIVAIKTLLVIGADRVIDYAHRCHVNAPMNPYPSLALGCVDGTLVEGIGMFNIFANDGVYVEPYSINWIKDRWGTKLFKHTPVSDRALSSRVCGQVTKVLGFALERIRVLKGADTLLPCQAISKTGTSNDSRSCWFIGSTPSYTTAIYVGCDDNRSLGDEVYSSGTIFPLWYAYTKTLACTQKNFVYDPALRPITINDKTGVLSTPDAENAVTILV